MKRRSIVIVVLVVAIAAYVATRRGWKPAAPLPGEAAGTPAPEFSLTDLNGQALDLSSYRGKVVLLDFWATWCAPCRSEIPQFVAMQDKYRERGLQIVGISLDDSAAPVRTFYTDYKMNYPVALGDAGLAERYGGILGLPVAFLIDRQGRICAKHVGETDISALEREVASLLKSGTCAAQAAH